MKKKIFIFLILLMLLVLSGCKDKGVVIYQFDDEANPTTVEIDSDYVFNCYTKEYIDDECIITVIFEDKTK